MIHRIIAICGISLFAGTPSVASAQSGLADGSFDSQGATLATYCYFPSCPVGPWTGSTGLIHGGNPDWGGLPAASPSTMAFIQQSGQLTQTFTATATARVRLAWLEADRPNFGGLTYIVSINGVALGTYTSSTSAFKARVSDAFDLVSGASYTITMAGQSPSIDRSSFIDNVRLVSPGSATSYQYDAMGRLVRANGMGGVNDGVTSSYTYDRASNRTEVTVSGAPR